MAEAEFPQELIVKEAIRLAEQDGIVFIDEIDKIVNSKDRWAGGLGRGQGGGGTGAGTGRGRGGSNQPTRRQGGAVLLPPAHFMPTQTFKSGPHRSSAHLLSGLEWSPSLLCSSLEWA